MPPARSRAAIVVDDTRSDISSTGPQPKDRGTLSSTAALPKTKKKPATAVNAAANFSGSLSKFATTNSAAAVHTSSTHAPADNEAETPHIDWSTLPLEVLHSYRSAHRLQISSAYTRAHAEILYRSSSLALRAPSQVQARRKMLDLRAHRKRTAAAATEAAKAAASANTGAGVKPARKRQRIGRGSMQPQEGNNSTTATDQIAQSIEPPSPRSNPSHATVSDHSTPSDQLLLQQQQQQQNHHTEDPYTIPSTLNQHDPESTLTGFQPPSALATAIRKHSNAQQVSENETIARLTYIVRQQGSQITPRIVPVPHRSHVQATAATTSLLPSIIRTLPTTAIGSSLADISLTAAQQTLNQPYAPAQTQTQAQTHTQTTTKSNPYSAVNSLTATITLGGGHVHTEGSLGDGRGWIMGTHGRQVKTSDAGVSGGGGQFRLRFRP